MKKIVLFILLSACIGRCLPQKNCPLPNTCPPNRQRCQIDTVKADVNKMSQFLDNLNAKTLDSLIRQFAACRDSIYDDRDKNKALRDRIDRDTLAFNTFEQQISRNFYPGEICKDTSYLFYFGNYEIKNYVYSLRLLKLELKKVLTPDNTLSSINSNNFMSSYNYMNQCRGALFTRMNSIEMEMLIDTMKARIARTDSLLRSPYLPPKKFDSFSFSTDPYSLPEDRIGSAAQLSLYNTKKQAQRWGIVNGVLIVLATALILSYKNH